MSFVNDSALWSSSPASSLRTKGLSSFCGDVIDDRTTGSAPLYRSTTLILPFTPIHPNPRVEHRPTHTIHIHSGQYRLNPTIATSIAAPQGQIRIRINDPHRQPCHTTLSERDHLRGQIIESAIESAASIFAWRNNFFLLDDNIGWTPDYTPLSTFLIYSLIIRLYDHDIHLTTSY